jgi:hypothetical protein
MANGGGEVRPKRLEETMFRLIARPVITAVLVLNVASVSVVLLCDGVGSEVHRSPESAFLQHLDDRQVGLDDQTEYRMGRSVCAELQEGAAQSELVATIDDIPDVSTPDAEAIVYWSVADLCQAPS